MIDVEAGQSSTFRFDLRSEGGTLAADLDSGWFTLLDATGVELIAATPLPTPAGSTSLNVTIASPNHTIGGVKLFDTRQLTVFWTTGGVTYRERRVYRVVPSAPYYTSEQNVRAVLGLTEDDLNDSDVDLMTSYVRLVAQFGTAFTTALQAGDIGQVNANDVLLYTEALRLIPSLQLRVITSNQDGALRVDRLKTIDFATLRRDIEKKLAEVSEALVATTDPGNTLLILSTPTDPITGA